jgi:hypothetical protein
MSTIHRASDILGTRRRPAWYVAWHRLYNLTVGPVPLVREARVMLRALYWFAAGALLGVGLLAILSIGVFLLLAGLILVVIGAIRLGARGLWAGLVGFGLLPALILQVDLSGSVPVDPASTAQTYQLLAIIFGAITLLGLIWALVATVRAWRLPARVG